ncbi:MAG: ComEC/Rec2 family competence protein [Vulcanibacillus sp.]
MTTKKSLWSKYWLWIIIIIPIGFFGNFNTDTLTVNNYNGELEVYFFDVGQGDATLFRGKDFTILIDAGRHDNNDVIPYLKSLGISSIDLLVGTHPHADHIGQMDDIINTFPVKEVWLSGDIQASETFENLINAIENNNLTYYEPRAGEKFKISSIDIIVLNPSTLTGDLNDDSISLLLQYGSVKFLLTGDTEAAGERRILDSNINIEADIFQAGHHGSNTSNTSAFLDAVNPEIVIYSAGIDNPYGHPHDEVIERMINKNITIYGTDIDGTIKVTSDGNTYDINTNYDGK